MGKAHRFCHLPFAISHQAVSFQRPASASLRYHERDVIVVLAAVAPTDQLAERYIGEPRSGSGIP